MSNVQPGVPDRPPVELKDPLLAAFLAWLIPGLGHFYQGRRAKAALYAVMILGIFAYGAYLGGNSAVGWGRVVYASWREDDKRLYYFGQVWVGLPALPALVQANRVRAGKPPLLDAFMAPPRLDDDPRNRVRLDGDEPYRPDEQTVSMLHKQLHRYFELGTVYTLIAGLLNVLAIYDALAGPFWAANEKKDDDEEAGPPAKP